MVNEKKLKKLNRLELLELLFEVSKENEQLKEENRELKHLLENNTNDNKAVDSLALSVRSLETAVSEIKEISERFSETIETGVGEGVHASCEKMTEGVSENGTLCDYDATLFFNLLKLFRQKPFLAGILPDDMKEILKDRINNM